MSKQNRYRAVSSKKHLARVERENLQRKYILWASGIVLALVVGFILYGILDQTVLKPRQPVAIVNGESITTREYQARVRYTRNSIIQRWYETYQFSQMFGDDPSTMQYFSGTLSQLAVQLTGTSLGQQVLDSMVEEALIRQEAARRGISISREELDKAMQEFFGFYQDGTPTPAPTSEPVTTPTLSATQIALLPPTATAVPTATPEVEGEIEEAPSETPAEVEEQPTETAVVVETEETPAEPAEPTATLAPSPTATVYTIDLFQENYKESLDYLADNLNINEAEFRRIIENQLLRTRLQEALTADIVAEQEQAWARHILVTDPELAQEVLERLTAGEDFASLAAEVSTDGSASNGGDLGWFSRDMMVAEFSSAAFDLEIGEISPVVQSQFGYHIIQLLGKDVFPLSDSQLDQLRQTRFQEWLTSQREASEIGTFDRWLEVMPTQPSIPDELLAQVQQQLESSSSAIPPIESLIEEEEEAPVQEDQ